MREHYNLKKVSLIVLLMAILLAIIFGMCLNEDESLKMEDFSFNLPEGYSVVNVTDNNCSIAYGNENTHVGGLEISQMKKSVLSTKGTTEIMTYLQENFHKTNNVEFAAFVGGEKRPYVCITLTKIDDVTGEKCKYYHVFFEKNRHVCHAWFDEDVIDQEVEKHIISLLIEK